MQDRTILVGDIHGCLEEFDELLKKIEYKADSDRLILLGDLVDRGPNSVGVVRRARELQAESVMGNHEYKYIKWFRSNKQVYEKNKFYDEFNDDDIEYIHKMPSFIRLDKDIVALHAGVKPWIPIEKQNANDLMHLRYIDKDWNKLSLKKVFKDKVDGVMFWTDFWKGPESIIYGHNVHSYDLPKIDEVAPGVKCCGLDTGCCFGGKLTAMILETFEIVQVSAKQIYYQSDYLYSD